MARHNGSLIGALNRPTSANFSGITTINGKRQQAMKNQAGRIGVFDFADRLYFNKGMVSLPEMRQLKQESNWPIVTSDVEYLVVAGGGGSAYGGGGGGGLLDGNESVNIHQTLTITVGAGGQGYNVTSQPNIHGEDGEDSSIAELSLTAIGGGGGGDFNTPSGNSGGSGGGGGYSYSVVSGGSGTSGQGNAGGNGGVGVNDARTGGGGGATSAGQNGGATVMGAGGDGKQSSITGTAVYYAGGGGGLARPSSGDTNGSIGLGGGSGNYGGGGHAQGSGGAGIVILRYLTREFRNITTGSPSTSTDGDYTVITFTSDGSITI